MEHTAPPAAGWLYPLEEDTTTAEDLDMTEEEIRDWNDYITYGDGYDTF